MISAIARRRARAECCDQQRARHVSSLALRTPYEGRRRRKSRQSARSLTCAGAAPQAKNKFKTALIAFDVKNKVGRKQATARCAAAGRRLVAQSSSSRFDYESRRRSPNAKQRNSGERGSSARIAPRTIQRQPPGRRCGYARRRASRWPTVDQAIDRIPVDDRRANRNAPAIAPASIPSASRKPMTSASSAASVGVRRSFLDDAVAVAAERGRGNSPACGGARCAGRAAARARPGRSRHNRHSANR